MNVIVGQIANIHIFMIRFNFSLYLYIIQTPIIMKAIALLCVFLTTGLISFSQINTTLSRNYGGPGYDQMFRFYQSSDAGFYWGGYTKAAGDNIPSIIGGDDAWFMKVNSSGDSLHSAVFGGTGDDYLVDVLEITSSQYVLLFESNSTDNGFAGGHGSKDVWIKGYDLTAGLSTGSTFGGSLADEANRITPKNAGGYLLTGNTFSSDGNISFNYGMSDIWVVSLQSNLSIAWSRQYGGSSDDRGIASYQLTDGSIMVFGTTASTNYDVHDQKGNTDVFVMKLNSLGDTLWTRTYGGTATDVINEVKFLSDTSFALVGYSNSNNGDFMFRDRVLAYYGFYYVIDENGDFRYAGSLNTMDDNDMEFTDAIVDSAYHAMTFGGTMSDSVFNCPDSNNGGNDLCLVDFNGIMEINPYLIGGADDDGVNITYQRNVKAVKTGNNQYAFCTHTRSTTLAPDFHGMTDVWVNGFELQHQSIPEAQQLQITVYPNPAENLIMVNSENSGENAQYEVFDMQGKLLLHGEYEASGINISLLENGLYLLKLRSGDSTGIARFVKQ